MRRPESPSSSSTVSPAIVASLSSVLEQICETNSKRPVPKDQPPCFTRFEALTLPGISVRDYLARIGEYSGCSSECFTLALIYIDRITQKHTAFFVNSYNVHRLLITSIMVASKYFDDVYNSNAYFARVGGVDVKELNILETEFLFLCNFAMFVETDLYDRYNSELILHANGVALAPNALLRGISSGSTSSASAPPAPLVPMAAVYGGTVIDQKSVFTAPDAHRSAFGDKRHRFTRQHRRRRHHHHHRHHHHGHQHEGHGVHDEIYPAPGLEPALSTSSDPADVSVVGDHFSEDGDSVVTENVYPRTETAKPGDPMVYTPYVTKLASEGKPGITFPLQELQFNNQAFAVPDTSADDKQYGMWPQGYSTESADATMSTPVFWNQQSIVPFGVPPVMGAFPAVHQQQQLSVSTNSVMVCSPAPNVW